MDKLSAIKTASQQAVIPSLQFLRTMAGTMVLVFHACFTANAYGGYAFGFSNAGAAGVDVFFVISGFIITYVTHASPPSARDFLMRRLIRIAPSYWFYTLLTVAILLALPSAFSRLKFDPAHTLLSSLFLLSTNNANTVGTVLGVGWTVCYEFYFYLLFALFMLVPRRFALPGMAGAIVLGALLEPLVTVPPFAAVAFSALPLEFLAGCLLARLYLGGWILPGAWALGCIAAGFALIYWAGMQNVVASERDPWRVLYFGVPALCLTAGFISLDARRLVRFPSFLTDIGDASYSLYLLHQFVLVAVAKCWTLFGLQRQLPVAFLLAASIMLSMLAALLAYRLMEKPVTCWLNANWHRMQVRTVTLA